MIAARPVALLALNLAEAQRTRKAIAEHGRTIPVPRTFTLDGHNAAREISQPIDYELPEHAIAYVSAGVQRTVGARRFLDAFTRANGAAVELRNLDRESYWPGWETEEQPEPAALDETLAASDVPADAGDAVQEHADRLLAAVTGRRPDDQGITLPPGGRPGTAARVAAAALHPCPRADGAPCSLVPGSPGCCDDGDGEEAPDVVDLAAGGISTAEIVEDDTLDDVDELTSAEQVLADGGLAVRDQEDCPHESWEESSTGRPLRCADCGQSLPDGWSPKPMEPETPTAEDLKPTTASAGPEPSEVATWIYVRGSGWWDGPWKIAAGEALDDVGNRGWWEIQATSSVPLDQARQLPGTPR